MDDVGFRFRDQCCNRESYRLTSETFVYFGRKLESLHLQLKDINVFHTETPVSEISVRFLGPYVRTSRDCERFPP